MISDNPAEAAWHSRAAWAARSAMAGRGAATAPIAVELHFEMRRPHASVYEWPSMGDTDKLARSVLDAMSGIVYVDDRHVVSLVAHKRYATSGPGCRVRVVALTREELNA